MRGILIMLTWESVCEKDLIFFFMEQFHEVKECLWLTPS